MTHHAYIYEGSQHEREALAREARTRFGFAEGHDPDVHVRTFEKFGIDESRWLTDAATLKPASGRALYVLGIASITSEAQQALLKLFEEPQQGVVFVVLLPHGLLLPTLRSRMLAYPVRVASDEGAKDARTFLALTGKERSEFIAKLLKDKDEEGSKERVRDFVNALERALQAQVKEPASRDGLEDLAMVRDYLSDRAPSLKMLLEHLAVALPRA